MRILSTLAENQRASWKNIKNALLENEHLLSLFRKPQQRLESDGKGKHCEHTIKIFVRANLFTNSPLKSKVFPRIEQ
jgi:hypothetical protein